MSKTEACRFYAMPMIISEQRKTFMNQDISLKNQIHSRKAKEK